MRKLTVLTALWVSIVLTPVGYALLLKSGDPLPDRVPQFSRIRFQIDDHRFHVDAKLRCRYNSSDRFRYRHDHLFTSPTNVYFEIGTVLKVTDSVIVYGETTNDLGSASCYLIDGKSIIPNRFVPNF